MRGTLSLLVLVVMSLAPVAGVKAASGPSDTGRPSEGARLFSICAACHSLRPDISMTGPSLHGVWGRKAGTLKSFPRYSPALKASGVVWNAQTLDAWLTDPARFIPHNWMTFPGIRNADARAVLIAYLKTVSASPPAMPPGQPTGHPDLKTLAPADRVTAIRYCREAHAYYVTNGDNDTRAFWEANLRFKTDSSELGPAKGVPAILRAGMMGDRVSVFFSSPEEISAFIKDQC
jgi:cytochrome c